MPQEPIDLDRSRKLRFRKTARKPAPALVPDRLTVKMTVKMFKTTESSLRINSLVGSLTIECKHSVNRCGLCGLLAQEGAEVVA